MRRESSPFLLFDCENKSILEEKLSVRVLNRCCWKKQEESAISNVNPPWGIKRLTGSQPRSNCSEGKVCSIQGNKEQKPFYYSLYVFWRKIIMVMKHISSRITHLSCEASNNSAFLSITFYIRKIGITMASKSKGWWENKINKCMWSCFKHVWHKVGIV